MTATPSVSCTPLLTVVERFAHQLLNTARESVKWSPDYDTLYEAYLTRFLISNPTAEQFSTHAPDTAEYTPP